MTDLVIASNRGPLSFALDDAGELETRRGSGGLVNTLGAAVAGTGALWVSSAITDADRAAAKQVVEAEGFRSLSLVLDPATYRSYYDVIANGVLWFLHHNLYDVPRRPRFDRHVHEAWGAYRDVNQDFAVAIAEHAGDGATVLVHDYHLALVGKLLCDLRPDVRVAHFHHTPFTNSFGIRILPEAIASDLVGGMTHYRACGFHSYRWVRAFESACGEVIGVERVPPTFVAPAAPDLDDVIRVAASPAGAEASARLDAEVGDRRVIVRVDRIEPSKNLLRGFHSFDLLLEERPEWRERVVFAAFIYPSRDTLPDYQAYAAESSALVEYLNAKWGTPTWTPVLLDTVDDFVRSVAALRRADVLLVNPVRDGLNLVAKEGVAVNERDGVLVLSREAGVYDELGAASVGINPFDVAATADALDRALSMSLDERQARMLALREAVWKRRPSDWLDDQLRAARGD
jgi:trehalose 6-phosphate synthase